MRSSGARSSPTSVRSLASLRAARSRPPRSSRAHRLPQLRGYLVRREVQQAGDPVLRVRHIRRGGEQPPVLGPGLVQPLQRLPGRAAAQVLADVGQAVPAVERPLAHLLRRDRGRLEPDRPQMVRIVENDLVLHAAPGLGDRDHHQVDLAPVGVLSEDPLVCGRDAGELVVVALHQAGQPVYGPADLGHRGIEVLGGDAHAHVEVGQPVTGPAPDRARHHQKLHQLTLLRPVKQPEHDLALPGHLIGQALDPRSSFFGHAPILAEPPAAPAARPPPAGTARRDRPPGPPAGTARRTALLAALPAR